jgi:hypothetical protein
VGTVLVHRRGEQICDGRNSRWLFPRGDFSAELGSLAMHYSYTQLRHRQGFTKGFFVGAAFMLGFMLVLSLWVQAGGA